MSLKAAAIGIIAFLCGWAALEEWYAGGSWLFNLAVLAVIVFLAVYFLVVYLPRGWHKEDEEGGDNHGN